MILVPIPRNWWAYDPREDRESYTYDMPQRRKSQCPVRGGGGYYFFTPLAWEIIEPTSGIFSISPADYHGLLVATPHIKFEEDAEAIMFKLIYL